MKKITNYLAAVAAFSIVLSSCTVEKRLHNTGYHVAWKKSFKSAKNENVTDEVAVKEIRVKEVSAKNAMISTEAVDQINLETEAVNTINETVQVPVIESTVATNETNTISTKKVAKVEQTSKKINSASSKMIQKAVAKKIAKAAKNSGGTDIVLLYVLCFFIPFVAVGLATDWDIKQVIINILLSCLCGIPGIIHALIVVKNNA